MFVKILPVVSLGFAISLLTNGETIEANSDNNTIRFPHDSCQTEVHGTFDFSIFHNAKPFFDEGGTMEMLVRFKGPADAHIALTVNANSSEPLYMIIIGSYNNKITEIRRTKSAQPKAKLETIDILSNYQWRGFIIKYNRKSGKLSVFPEGSDSPLIQWIDNNPLNIAFYSFATYRNRVLQVAFDCRATDIYSSIPKVAGGKFKSNLLYVSAKSDS